MANPVPLLSSVSMTVTAFLYVLISSFTDNLADVMRKSIAGMENVCGIRANTLKNMAKAISQKVHLGNRRFDFDFGSFASCAFATALLRSSSTHSYTVSSANSSYTSSTITACYSLDLYSIRHPAFRRQQKRE